MRQPLDFIGATNRIRTYDPLITNEMLCQLSYSGKYSYIIFTRPIVVNTFFKTFLIFFEEALWRAKTAPLGKEDLAGLFS